MSCENLRRPKTLLDGSTQSLNKAKLFRVSTFSSPNHDPKKLFTKPHVYWAIYEINPNPLNVLAILGGRNNPSNRLRCLFAPGLLSGEAHPEST